jgi:DNA-directed RNA polymerase specialized sigma subunit
MDTCTELCKKAEKYISQDYVYQREILKPPSSTDKKNLEYIADKRTKKNLVTLHELMVQYSSGALDEKFLSKTERQCMRLHYIDGLTHKEIAHRLSNQHRQLLSGDVTKCIYRAKRKILAKHPLIEGTTYIFWR